MHDNCFSEDDLRNNNNIVVRFTRSYVYPGVRATADWQRSQIYSLAAYYYVIHVYRPYLEI